METMQAELYAALLASFDGLPACAVSGCEVQAVGNNLYTVMPGIVYMNKTLYRFNGQTNVSLPMELFPGAPVMLDERPYETGGSKPSFREDTLNTRGGDGGTGVKLIVRPEGVLRVEKAREARTRRLGVIEAVAMLVTDDYDQTGKGRYGTTAHGWALCNSENGTVDLRRRFLTGYDPENSDYDTVGKTGGQEKVGLTAEEGPAHSHGMTSVVKYNSGNPVTFDAGSSGAKAANNANGGLNTTNASGSGQPHENRPPFYVVAYTQWIGIN